MNHTVYMAYSGMRSRAEALDILSNNLANAGATGFRGQQVRFESLIGLAPEDASPMALAVNGPLVTAAASNDLSEGGLESTGNPLDLALEGPGFFTVSTPEGIRYTRAGSFRLDAANQLVTSSGYPVLAATNQSASPNDRITVPPGAVEVSPQGSVAVNGVDVARLRIVDFADPAGFVQLGGGLTAPQAGNGEVPSATQVRQSYLEKSNVNPIRALSGVLQLMREFEMMSRIVQSLSKNVDQRLINEVARV